VSLSQKLKNTSYIQLGFISLLEEELKDAIKIS
jgi:hypothetical protein